MDDPFMDTSRNLARWLQEAGRRTKRAAASSDVDGRPGAARSWRNGAMDRGLERAKWPLLVALSACAFLQYRSEEHTSELQSRLHLVCRLLLEKKKKFNKCQ